MKRSDKLVTHFSVACVGCTGVVYGVLRYFGSAEDEFGPVQHPLVPTLQWLHVVTAPLFVFALGLIWHGHVVQKLRSGAPQRRRTGLLLLSQALPMTATGYLLQVSVEQAAIADEVMSILMGDDVEQRKNFIVTNAREVRNLDF